VNGVAERSLSTRPESSCKPDEAPRNITGSSAAVLDSSGNGNASLSGSAASDPPAGFDRPVISTAAPSDAPVVLSFAEEAPPSGPGVEEKTPPPTYLDLPGDRPITRDDEFELLFFDELPTETWLAHELEMGDPRMIQKMTETAALRRAHFAKYVKGIVGVAAALCVIAAIKAAVPSGDGGFVPAVDQLPAAAAQPAPAVQFARDGGGW
jgi:hypothetical protein